MANETLYGCINWATGYFEFEQDPDCKYYAYVVWEGVHAGQVAVIVDTLHCSPDLYYGCVDWATGKFKVIVPDDCCTVSGDNCPCDRCEPGNGGPGIQPYIIRITITEVLDPDGCFETLPEYEGNDSWKFYPVIAPFFNRTWTLYHTSFCFYESAEYNPSGQTFAHHYNYPGCFDYVGSGYIAKSRLRAGLSGDPLTLTIRGEWYQSPHLIWWTGFLHESVVEIGQFCIPQGGPFYSNESGGWHYTTACGVYTPLLNHGRAHIAIPFGGGNDNLCTS